MRAAEWLQSLVKRESTADPALVSSVDMFTSILGAARKCASSDVLEMAEQVFDQLRASHHTVEPIHYSRLLQVGLLAMSHPEKTDARTSFVRKVMQECKEAGLVSSLLVQALANGPVYVDGWTVAESKESVLELFPDWPLPPSWTRNVRQLDLLPKRIDFYRAPDKRRTVLHGVDPFPHSRQALSK